MMPARKKSGFTLIELLVVIAIIAILAAILFPVFARAREAARKSNCQNNIKECAVALQLYWNDYDSTLPSSMVTSTVFNTNGYSADNAVKFVSELGRVPVPQAPTGTDRPYTWASMLYNHMKNKDIMFCPSDSSATDKDNPKCVVSYWYKWANDLAWYLFQSKKESSYGYNSDQIAFYEHMGWHFGESAGLHNGSQINVAYMDSHVKTINLSSSLAPTASNPGLATTSTHPSDAANLANEPFLYNFNNDDTATTAVKQLSYNTGSPAYIDPKSWSDKL